MKTDPDLPVTISRDPADGEWRSGKKTLLGALGVEHNEVVMCRGLAWLLTPNGWHGLETAVLDGLLSTLGVDPEGSAEAQVSLEETRENTRADLLVRFGAATLLIEAKIWAGEGAQQCDRLARLWADETPTLVFLTRTGDEPRSAERSRGHWRPLTWSSIADIVDGAIDGRENVNVGVQEYLRTLRFYGGKAIGSDDAKFDALLRLWAGGTKVVDDESQSTGAEWADIEERAGLAVRNAILSAAKHRTEEPQLPVGGGGRSLYITIAEDPLVQVVLHWDHNPNTRTSGMTTWPHVVVSVDPKRSPPLYQAILEATAFTEIQFGMVNTMTTPWWLRSGPIVPSGEAADAEAYANQCIERLLEVWAAVRPVVDDLLCAPAS